MGREPGISRHNFEILAICNCTSELALRAPRKTGHVSTNPVLDPLAAESFRPWGSAR
jgi:hypothetical protein